METINANAAFLCNFEVMQLLQELKDSSQKKHKREGSLATVTYETVHFLQETECKHQSIEGIQNFLEAMKQFKLTKTEKLMMVNTPPRTELEIQLIVQESEERLSEDEVQKILKFVVNKFSTSMSRIILHRAMGSPAARSVQMLADILDLQLQIKEVNIIKRENKTPEFKKLNPMQTVPVIEDGDFVLSESHAIMKYLLYKYGEGHKERLYPSELQARAVVDQCMYFNAGVFFKALLNCAGETLMGNLTEPTRRHKAEIESSYGILEAYLCSRAYLAADRLTLADLAAGSTVTAIQYMHAVDQDKFPKCTDWVARLEEETFFKTVNKEGAVFFGKLLNAFWKKNKLANAQ